jgi:hypothetical protein
MQGCHGWTQFLTVRKMCTCLFINGILDLLYAALYGRMLLHCGLERRGRTLRLLMSTLLKQEIEPSVDSSVIPPEAVRAELRQIISSRHFRSSKRSQQFLEYVVEQKLLGNESFIKERLIGVEVFGRDNNYATGDDPVVRVQAGDVRRRLELYRAESRSAEGVWVDLPTGTYVPVFRRRQSAASVESSTADSRISQENSAEPAAILAPVPAGSALPLHPVPYRERLLLSERGVPERLRLSVRVVLFSLLLLVIGGAIGYLIRTPGHPTAAVSRFWGPVLSSQRAVVISLGRPFVYAPSARLFEEYAKTHPGAFAKGVDRHNQFLPLDGSTQLQWSDLVPVSNSGPAIGGVRGSLTLTSFLGRLGKPFNVRFGDEGSFLESRDSPSIIVGAINNRWTTDLDKDFHFGIHDNNSYQYIAEAGTDHIWRTEYSDRGTKDFALITREPAGSTGQFLLKVAGLEDGGTEAACELITNPEMLQDVIHGLPPHWETKNLQILIATVVIGRKAGPPQVLAVHVW